jgi:Ca2+-binding EF-hand superfamily protein
MGNKTTKPDFKILTEDQILLITSNTKFDREQIQDWHRNFMRDHPQGRIKKSEFCAIYGELFPDRKSNDFIVQVFKLFDLNNSGYIDFDELLLCIETTTIGDVRKKIELAFQIYDLDRNGFIDKNEMTRMIEAIFDLCNFSPIERAGKLSAKERTKEIMQKMNVDKHEGLSRQEFVDGLMTNDLFKSFLVPNA